jgi:hypothetical protein
LVRRQEAVEQRASRRPTDMPSPMFGNATSVFYADLVAGALMGIVVLVIRQRHASTVVRRWWAVAGAIVGAFVGACVFVPVFMFSEILSVGFSSTPLPLLFAMTLLGILFVLAWLASFQWRRRR